MSTIPEEIHDLIYCTVVILSFSVTSQKFIEKVHLATPTYDLLRGGEGDREKGRECGWGEAEAPRSPAPRGHPCIQIRVPVEIVSKVTSGTRIFRPPRDTSER
jgi:hypothetical protein